MRKYIIYCTTEQTKKACELGAPITKIILDKESGTKYFIPTAEQMIGWLEEQDEISDISILYLQHREKWIYQVYVFDGGYIDVLNDNYFSNRKEATLAAIDVALEYLTNNKK